MQRDGSAGVRQRRDRALQQFALDVEQRHAPALGEKPLRHRKPDAASGASDQCDLLWERGHEQSIVSKPVPALSLARSRRVCFLIRTTSAR